MQPTPYHTSTASPFLSPIPPRSSRLDSLTRSAIVFPVTRSHRSSVHYPSPSIVGRRSSVIGSTLLSPSSQLLLPTQSAIPVPLPNPFATGLSTRSSYVPRGRRSSLSTTSLFAPSMDTIYTSSPPARIARVVTRVHSPHGRSPPKEFTTTYSLGPSSSPSPPSPPPDSSSSSKPPSTMFITP
ncbi:hypothetical protein FOZ63_027616 [Perkinsus olseni]|uniref:Uncharacterized protein n=1 Tax=Perkinsus olseni TaxID=32597 RepID=A0A7J6PP60_PEROL|nr:hypothetical protein FOZ63_027616 [Perkinsus olseni]